MTAVEWVTVAVIGVLFLLAVAAFIVGLKAPIPPEYAWMRDRD